MQTSFTELPNRLIFLPLTAKTLPENGCSGAAITDREENKHLYRPAPPHMPWKTVQAVWIHASRHIKVNRDDEEKDRKILNDKGHWVTDTSAIRQQCFSHLNEK